MAATMAEMYQPQQNGEDWHGGAYRNQLSPRGGLRKRSGLGGSTPEYDTTATSSPGSVDTSKSGNALAQMGAALQAQTGVEKDALLFKNLTPQLDAAAAEPSKFHAVGEKVKIYFMQVRDGVVEIVGKVGGRIVFVKASISEVARLPFRKLGEVGSVARAGVPVYFSQAKQAANAGAVRILDGCISIAMGVEDGLVMVKAKVVQKIYVAKAKAVQTGDAISAFTKPTRSRVGSNVDKSKARVYTALRPLEPYYMKVHNGVLHIAAIVGNAAVFIQAKVSDIKTSIQVRTLESLHRAQAAIAYFTNPIVSRTMRFYSAISQRVEYFAVSLKKGMFRIRGATGELIVKTQCELSNIVESISTKAADGLRATKDMISDLTSKLAAIASRVYSQTVGSARLLYTQMQDGFWCVVYRVNDRLLVFRIKINEVIKYVCSWTGSAFASSRSAFLDICNSIRAKTLRAAKVTKTKAIEVGTGVRSVAAKGKTQVVVASAAGGAVALGAGGGAAGFVAGGGVGAGCGVIFAPFTLGLSIPVGAALGAGTGLCVGTTAGGTAGAIAGGAAGYGAHKHKDQIGNGVNGAVSKARTYKSMAAASTNKLRAQVMGSTGGAGLA